MPIPDVVGDQQGKRRKVRRKRSVGKAIKRAGTPKYSGTPYQQQKRAKQITRSGRVRYRTKAKSGQRAIVKTAGGKTKVVSRKTRDRAYTKARRDTKARKAYARSLGFKSLQAYADASPYTKANQSKRIAARATTQTAGLSAELKRRWAPATRGAINLLAETSRPIHGIAGGVYAAQKGKNVLKGAKRGFELKDRKLFSDVLKEAGAPKVVQTVGGFGLDVGLDPTTYVTLGSSVPVKAAARAAEKATAEKFAAHELKKAAAPVSRAVKKPQKTTAGIVKTETERAVKRLEDRAQRKGRSVTPSQRAQAERRVQERFGATPGEGAARRARKRAENAGQGNRGLTVGLGRRGKVKTSGRATAAVSRTLGVPNVAKATKESGPVQVVGGALNADFVPAGVSRSAHRKIRRAEAKARHAADSAERQIGARAREIQKNFSKADYRTIIDSVEAGTVHKLKAETPDLHAAAVAIRSDLRHMARKEKQAGLRSTVRENYIPHLRRQDVESAARVIHGPTRASGAKLGSAKQRKLEGSLKDWREKDPSLFEDDLAKVYAHRAGSSAKALGSASLVREVAAQGRKLTPKAEWDTELEAVYRVTPTGLKPLVKEGGGRVDARTIEKAAEGKAPGQYVILPKELADGLTERVGAQKLGRGKAFYRRQHGRYKTLLTQPMPSYHLRNLYGDTSNASYKQNVGELGVNITHSARALRDLRKVRKADAKLTVKPEPFTSKGGVRIGGKKVPYSTLLKEAERHGGLSQGFSRELTEMLEKGEGGLRNIGQSRENLIRFASYIGARKQGLSAVKAGERVKELHFDYGDLTKVERSLRDIFPFYTFAARNTPLQAKTLVTRPGKLARYDKFLEEGGKAAGLPEDWQDHLKEYQEYGVAMPLFGAKQGPDKLLGLPGLPLTDLNRLTLNPREQFRQGVSMVSGLKTVAELLQSEEGFSYFFRGPIDTGTKVAAPDWLHKILPPDAQRRIGLEYVHDRSLGRKVWKYSPKVDYVLKQLPETSFLFGITSTGKNRRNQDKALKALGLTGVKAEPYDPDAVAVDRLYKVLDKVQKRKKQLNSEGVYTDTPTKEFNRLKAREKKLNAEIDRLKLKQRKAGKKIKLPRRLEGDTSGGKDWRGAPVGGSGDWRTSP